MIQEQRIQKFRVYQLDLEGLRTYPFAFREIKVMYDAGFRQPPAEDYCLVYDGEISCGSTWEEITVLEYIYARCNTNLPQGYLGHSLSMSDVVELYDDEGRHFYYCDEVGFTSVAFTPELTKPIRPRKSDV